MTRRGIVGGIHYEICPACGKGVWKLTEASWLEEHWVHPAKMKKGCKEALEEL